MVGYKIYFLFLLNVIVSDTAKLKPPKSIRSSGVMRGEPGKDVYLVPNEPWSFTIFGKDLPPSGWMLTSSSNCKDLGQANPDEVEVPLTTIYPLDSEEPVFYRRTGHVTLRAMNGVPFKYDSREKFLICHPEVHKGMTMVIRSKYSRIDWWKCIFVVIFLVGSAFCSGTSIAFFTYNTQELQSIIEASIDEKETFHAQRILWYRRKSNYLICSFSVANCIMNVLLTNCCEDIFKNHRNAKVVGVVASTCLTVALGEIFPQAIGSRYGLWVASTTRLVTLFLFIIMAPFAYPLSKLTDLILGREAREVLPADQLKSLLTHHASHLCTDQEGEIFRRTVKFQDMTIRDIMRPLNEVFALSDSYKYTPELALNLVERGMYSRIPVFYGKNTRNICGCINMTDLLNKPKDGATIGQIMLQTKSHMRWAPIDMKLQILSEEMKTGEHHMCVVSDFRFNQNEVIGLVTSEDVWEQLFGDIQDDLDLAFGNKRTGIRVDQATLDWYKEKDRPLTCNQQLAIIQQLHNVCPELRWMGINVHVMRFFMPTTRELLTVPKGEKLTFDSSSIYVICFGEFEAEITAISTDCSTSDFQGIKEVKEYHCDTKKNGQIYVLNASVATDIASDYIKNFPSFKTAAPQFTGFNELELTKYIKAKRDTKYFIITTAQIARAIRTTADEDGSDTVEGMPVASKCRTTRKSPPPNERTKAKEDDKPYKTEAKQADETIPLLEKEDASITDNSEDSTQPSISQKL